MLLKYRLVSDYAMRKQNLEDCVQIQNHNDTWTVESSANYIVNCRADLTVMPATKSLHYLRTIFKLSYNQKQTTITSSIAVKVESILDLAHCYSTISLNLLLELRYLDTTSTSWGVAAYTYDSHRRIWESQASLPQQKNVETLFKLLGYKEWHSKVKK